MNQRIVIIFIWVSIAFFSCGRENDVSIEEICDCTIDIEIGNIQIKETTARDSDGGIIISPEFKSQKKGLYIALKGFLESKNSYEEQKSTQIEDPNTTNSKSIRSFEELYCKKVKQICLNPKLRDNKQKLYDTLAIEYIKFDKEIRQLIKTDFPEKPLKTNTKSLESTLNAYREDSENLQKRYAVEALCTLDAEVIFKTESALRNYGNLTKYLDHLSLVPGDPVEVEQLRYKGKLVEKIIVKN